MFKKAATELLALKKDDVQSVLLATVHGKNEEIVKCLKLFPYFHGWSEKSIKECCILSSIKRFLPDTVILSHTDKNHSYTYFVIDGTCSVIQKMILKMKTGFNGRRIFTVHTDQNADDDHNLESIFGIIRNFVDGECFGLGEDMTNRWVVSTTAVRCLVIPKDFLLQHNENNMWPRARQKISSSFPSNNRIYRSLIRQVKWCRFKREYYQYLIKRRNMNVGTKLQDVPYYWRINVDVPLSLLY